jgi:hypothetical protein
MDTASIFLLTLSNLLMFEVQRIDTHVTEISQVAKRFRMGADWRTLLSIHLVPEGQFMSM